MEKILKRKVAYQGKIANIEEVDIDFGNGRKGQFELINFHVSTGVTMLPIDSDNNIILVSQYKLGMKKRIICLPSGGLDAGEDPKKIANKELQEEIGYKSNSLSLMFRSHSSPGYIGSEPAYFYLAKDLVASKIKGDEIEEVQIIKLPFDKVLQMVRSGEILDGKTICTVLYYKLFYTGSK